MNLSTSGHFYLGESGHYYFALTALASSEAKLSEVPLMQHQKPAKTLIENQEGNASSNDAIVAAYQAGGYTRMKLLNILDAIFNS